MAICRESRVFSWIFLITATVLLARYEVTAQGLCYANSTSGENIFVPIKEDSFVAGEEVTNLNFFGTYGVNITSITITSQSPAGYFTLDLQDGADFVPLVLNKTIDSDGPPRLQSITLEIECSSPQNSDKRTTRIIVTITDANDNTPEFQSTPYQTEISEYTQVGSSIFQLSATDIDSGANQQIVFSFLSTTSYFAVGTTNGEVTLSTSLDYETGPRQFEILVQVQDLGTPPRSSNTTLTIDVTDEDDLDPVFQHDIYEATVTENATASLDTSPAAILAYDQDFGINQTLVYSIEKASSTPTDLPGLTDYFSIDGSTGELSVVSRLDRETVQAVTLTIKAVQSDNNVRSAEARVYIVVQDANDNRPEMSSSLYTASVVENAPSGTPVLTVTASDKDEGQNAEFMYVLEPSDVFSIDGTTGYITVRNSSILDRETNNDFTLQVHAVETNTTEQYSSPPSTVVITLLDENDNSPTFSSDVYDAAVPEDAASGTVVTQVTATDPDSGTNGEIKYSIAFASGDGINKFSITEDGNITVSGGLDADTVDSYIVIVMAADQGSFSRVSRAIVNINVTNVNDNKPQFGQEEYTTQVSEAAATGTVVATLKATDGDRDAELTFQIEDGDFGQFSLLDASGGEVQVVTSAELDRETTDSYNITVQVSDGTYNATTQLIVTVQDVNDNFPVFNQTDYTFTIPEEQSASYVVGSILASDNDAGSNADISYSINPSSLDFSVNQSTGQISTLRQLDRETSPQLQFVVVAQDDGRPSLSSTAMVTVVLLDINDNLPIFTEPLYTVMVNENMTEPDLLTLQTTDLDSDPNNNTNYIITQGDTSLFNIDQTTGQLSLITPLDRDDGPDSYNLTLTVMAYNTEVYNGTGDNDTATVIVVVQDINDNAPVFSSEGYSTNILENVTVGSTVFTVNATDDDTDPANREISFSIVSGNDNGVFNIDQLSGTITVSNDIDFDPPTNNKGFELQIVATDGIHDTTAMVNITVTDVNDNAPEFSQDVYEAEVNETALDGSHVAMVMAADIDSGDYGNVAYSIVSGNENTFEIDEISGEITLATSLDHDQGYKSYQLIVEAKDGGIPAMSSSATVDILVVNENDNPPIFQNSTYSFEVYENERISSFVGIVQASDMDGDTLSYLIDSSVTGYFGIDSDTGEIITETQLDRETNTSFIFNVTVKDAEGLEDTAMVTVEVLDENDNSPVFDQETYSANVTEGVVGKPLILQVTASDEDDGSNSNITYSIRSGNNDDMFCIDSRTGAIYLQTNSTLDYEVSKDYYLSVKAQDGGESPRSDVADVTIYVVDVNESPPQCTQQPFQASLMENQLSPVQLLQVEVTHEDEAEMLEYEVVHGSNSTSPFSIDPATGMLSTTQSLDREEMSEYNLNVSVSDGENVEFCQVHITVLDQNDNVPQFFPSNVSHFNIEESAAIGTVVGQVHANDTDEGANGRVTFYLSSGADGKFAVDRESGDITVLAPLDYESLPDPNITLTVEAVDGGEEPKHAVSTVTISVMDVNDNAPEFDSSQYNFQVSENMNTSSSVGTVFAEDADEGRNGEVKYYLDTSGEEVPFNISEETGEITTTEVLDREGTNTSYTFKVLAMDNGTLTSLNSSTTVTVTITDQNDNPPEFNPKQYRVSILEQSPIGMVVAETSATDADVGTNAKLVYSLSGNGTKYFRVDDKGLVRINEILKVETLVAEGLISGLANETNSTTIRFQVVATDQGSPPLSGTAEVSVTVGDVKDATPVFGNSTYTARVAEDMHAGASLGFNISASSEDPDTVISFELLNWMETFELQQGDNMATVQVKSTLDRETRDSYELLVRATDDKIPQHTAYTTVEVTVTDINDEDPVFHGLPYHFTVSEAVMTDSTVGIVSATDQDLGKNGQVMYSITGDNGDVFSIDNTTGQIRTAQQLDRETTEEYNITVMATDMGSPARYTTALVTVSIADINDSPPTFSNSTYEVYIGETLRIGSSVFQLSATDQDSGPLNNLVYYAIKGGNNDDTFFMETQLGTIKTAARLGSIDTYTLSVQAYNPPAFVPDHGQLDSNATLTVHVNRAPRFSGQPYLKVLRENATVGTEVAQIITSDPDDDNITLSITDGNDLGVFYIDQLGVVRVSAPLNASTFQHILTVTALDDGNPALSRMAKVTVYVLPVDVSLPRFFQDLYEVTIPESLPPQSFVVMATAVYVTEDSVNYPLKYSIVTGNNGGYFKMDETTGSITTNRTLGNIPQSSTVLTVMVAVNGSQALTAMATVNITVVDQNDNAPVFDPANIEVGVQEDAVLGAEVVVLTATDDDKGRNAELMYFIHSGGDGKFTLDNSTGNLTVAGDLTDMGSLQYEIVVYAEDNGLPIDGLSPLRGYATVVITVADVNNHAPEFVQPTSPFYIMENTGPTDLGFIKVTDQDTAEVNKVVSYEITAGDEYSRFSINASSGLLESTVALDRENISSYGLVITAKNYRADPQLNSSIVVEIIVEDQNDNSPTFNSSDYTVQIDLTTSVGSEVIQVFADDFDEGANGDIWYFLKTDDSYSFYFTLEDPNQGIITTRNLFNFNDSVKVFNLQVDAYDGGEPRKSATTTVTVTVVNTAFNQPIFMEQQIVVSPLENQAANTTVVVLSASHYTDPSGEITYYCIRAGNELGNFGLNNKTGRLYTTVALDREDVPVYTLTVEAILVNGTGGCNNKRRRRALPANQIVVTVEVGDQNDNPPVFSQASYVKGIPDDAPVGYTVMQLQASDADTGSNAELTYMLVDAPPDMFQLESATGSLLTATSFTGSSGDRYKFIVEAEDKDGNTASADVTVFVLTFTQHVILEAGLPPADAIQNQDEIADFLQNITGYDINIHKIVPLEDESGKTNFSASEIWFYAVDPQTNEIVETSDVERVIAANREQWEEFLNKFSANAISQPRPITSTQNTFGILEGALIAMGGVILIGGLIALYAVHASWKKRKMENVNEVSMFEKYSVSEENNVVLTNPTYMDVTMEGPSIQVIKNDEVQETWVAPMDDLQQKEAREQEGNGDVQPLIQQDLQGSETAGGQRSSSSTSIEDIGMATADAIATEGKKSVTWASDVKNVTDSVDQDKIAAHAVEIPDDSDAKSDFANELVDLSPVLGPSANAAALMVTSQSDLPPFPTNRPAKQDKDSPEDFPPPPPLPFSDPPDLLPKSQPIDHNSNVPKDNPFSSQIFDSAITDTSTPKKSSVSVPGVLSPVPTPFTRAISLNKPRRQEPSEPLETILMSSPVTQVRGDVPVTDIDAILWDDEDEDGGHVEEQSTTL